MTRFLAILAAVTCAASAQTYRTVTADTNNVIRTNFTLGAGQISGAFAISNVTGLQSALDGKLATNGDAFALTNFPALLLTTNSDASQFPASLLRTNGDGGGLTNLPNANLSNATGVLPILNGGTGATNASGARTALELGTAATNDATAFQSANTNLTALALGDGSSLTNVTITDASSLTNFPAELLRTNGDGGGLTNISVDLTTVLPSYTGNTGKVLAVASGETNVEWTAISNTVTDASTLTNFPAIILQTNSADASFPAFILRTNGSAAALTNFPTLNQNTTGTASNVTGVVAIANGGSGQTTAAAAIEGFLPAYSGNADRILALNSNATALLWTTNAGGGGLTSPVAIVDGGTGATNSTDALLNFGIFQTDGRVTVGQSTTNLGTNGVVIGTGASASTGRPIVIGQGATHTDEISAVVIGSSATNSSTEDAVVIGTSAFSSAGVYNIAIGRSAKSVGGSSNTAIGYLAVVSNVGGSIQLGNGNNTTANSIQFRTAGTITTNEWATLSALSTYPTTNISVVGTNNTNTLVFSNGILTSVTTP